MSGQISLIAGRRRRHRRLHDRRRYPAKAAAANSSAMYSQARTVSAIIVSMVATEPPLGDAERAGRMIAGHASYEQVIKDIRASHQQR
jgi:hypothetical protein